MESLFAESYFSILNIITFLIIILSKQYLIFLIFFILFLILLIPLNTWILSSIEEGLSKMKNFNH